MRAVSNVATRLRFLRYLLVLGTIFNRTNSTLCEEWPTSAFVKSFPYEDKCYTWSKDKVTWDEAKDVCFDNGGSLVKISSPRLYNALMVNINESDQCLWIGANDKEEENDWRWLDGSRVRYSHWTLGDFHIFLRHTLDCGTICLSSDESSHWSWSQKTCLSRWQFICQYGVASGVQSSREHKNRNSDKKYRCKPWLPPGYDDFGQFGSKCYMGSTRKVTWDDAKLNCLHKEGQLAKVPSSDVYTVILSNLIRLRRTECYFIGASDREKEGNWRWIDGSEVSYNDWDSEIWHHLRKYTHDCAGICEKVFTPGDYFWSALPCGFSWEFICEYDAEEIPYYQVAVEKEKSGPMLDTLLTTTETSKFNLWPCGASTHILSKPDLKTTASLFTLCARVCSKLVGKCAIINYNKVTKECLGYSSRKVLKGPKERSENWNTWEVLK